MEFLKTRNFKIDVAALAVLLAAGLVAASLVGSDPADPPTQVVYPANAKVMNPCGQVGAILAATFIDWFGLAAVLIPAAGLSLSVSIFCRRSISEISWRSAGYLLLTTAGAALLQRADGRIAWPSAWITERIPVVGQGGMLGVFLAESLEKWMSQVGTLIVLVPVFLAGVLLAFDWLVVLVAQWIVWTGNVIRAIYAWMTAEVASWRTFLQSWLPVPKKKKPTPPFAKSAATQSAVVVPAKEASTDLPPIVRMDNVPAAEETAAPSPPRISALECSALSTFSLPGLDLLDDPSPFDIAELEQNIRERATSLEQVFAEFGMKVKVVQIHTGPVVTQYEIELEPGLRAGKVKALADDVSIAMKAQSVRIVAPIPGKNTVGIEIPNDKRAKVGLKEVITKSGDSSNMALPLYLGNDVKGAPLVFDLAKMPHLLIAGRTGTGKSVCLNALILSILMTRTPEQVKLLMIDPKMVELSLYKEIPHLMHPVVTDMKKAEALLAWAVDKMEERYELLSRVGVRHIDSYNKLSHGEIIERVRGGASLDDEERMAAPPHLPYILIFADEMADLMMTSAKEVETHIIRLAQKSRAVGIHLILATQKPTVDVITGLIKSNLPARIAFQVSSRSDSRVVLDEMGAEKLLGNGDMLFLYPGTSKIVRAQGTFVSDDEVTRMTEYLSAQCKPQFERELMELKSKDAKEETGESPKNLAERDELYEQAVEIVIREQRGSVSLLQRGLGVGYGRGARLIDFMAEDGIVGEYNGSQARDVLYTLDQWEDLKRNRFSKAG